MQGNKNSSVAYLMAHNCQFFHPKDGECKKCEVKKILESKGVK